MRNPMQYIVDDSSTKTSVIVLYDKWEKIITNYRKLQNKLKVFLAIQEGFGGVNAANK